MEIFKPHVEKHFQNAIGQEFYTYYLQESSRGTRLNVDTGVFKVKIIEESPNSVFMEYKYEVTEVLGNPTKAVREKLKYYIDSCHARSANTLYTTLEEAEAAYDQEIKDMIDNPRCNEDELNLLYKKLIKPLSELELAKMWYEALPDKHKNFIEILNLKK